MVCVWGGGVVCYEKKIAELKRLFFDVFRAFNVRSHVLICRSIGYKQEVCPLSVLSRSPFIVNYRRGLYFCSL